MLRVRKTASELQAIVMIALRQDPKCDDVESVTILHRAQQASHDPNWEVVCSIKTAAPDPLAAEEIMRQLQAAYELA
jgi:hypothetical protein